MVIANGKIHITGITAALVAAFEKLVQPNWELDAADKEAIETAQLTVDIPTAIKELTEPMLINEDVQRYYMPNALADSPKAKTECRSNQLDYIMSNMSYTSTKTDE